MNRELGSAHAVGAGIPTLTGAATWHDNSILTPLQDVEDVALAIVGMFNEISDTYRPDRGVLLGGMTARPTGFGNGMSRSDEIVDLWVRLLAGVFILTGKPPHRASASARSIVDGILCADALGRALGDRMIFHCALDRFKTQCLTILDQPNEQIGLGIVS